MSVSSCLTVASFSNQAHMELIVTAHLYIALSVGLMYSVKGYNLTHQCILYDKEFTLGSE